MKTTEEKNCMIAEFMGEIIEKFDNESLFNQAYNFHSSWDRLIPVVNLCVSRCKYSNQRDRITFALLSMNIEKMYNAVVQFIEWYNENK